MSKIDLSKAKVGDKFRTRDGRIATFHGRFPKSIIGLDYYVKIGKDIPMRCFVTGMWLPDEETQYDLIEQVFDKGDLLDNNISVEERGQALVEMAKSEYEKAKEFGVVIQNLPHIVEQLKEDNPELQRRQEVVELAEKLFTEKYLQEWYQHLVDNNTAKTDYVTYIFEWAEKFVNAKDKYLKEGKL